MVIFWRLILAHFIADFSLQTNHVATWKRESRWGMAVHVLTHPFMSIICTWPYLSQPWVQTRWFHLEGWVCVGFLALFHWLEDEWRVRSILDTGSPDNTLFFLYDQLVHIALILAFSPIPDIKIETNVLVILMAVLLSHFTSVLIFFLENDMWGESKVLGDKKYYYIGERLIGAALFLLPGPLFLLALGWVGWIFYIHYKRSHERTWINLVVGSFSVILLGLITRGLLS